MPTTSSYFHSCPTTRLSAVCYIWTINSCLIPKPTVFYQNIVMGTGKTITIIECYQLLTNYPRAKVLACALSNSAADLIASHLRKHLSTDELFQFYAPSWFKEQVLDDLLPYTFTYNGYFSVPMMTTVCDNILFSHEYEEIFYNLVIEGLFIVHVIIWWAYK